MNDSTQPPSLINTINSPKAKQVRLLIATDDQDELQRFWLLTLAPNAENLTRTVTLFNDSLITLFTWTSRRKEGDAWFWHLRINLSEPRHQMRYSKQDELLRKLQNTEWRAQFEQAFCLWKNYQGIFSTVLANIEIAEKAAKVWKEYIASEHTEEELRRNCERVLRLLTSHKNMARWEAAQ